MISSLLIFASAAIIGVLGLAHLIFTFKGPKLHPRDTNVADAMKKSSLVLTKETTVWKAWLGFNASHSVGAIFFALVFSYLAMQHSLLLFSSFFLQALGLVTLIALAVLAKAYWFRVPLIGIGTALILYVFGLSIA